MKENNIVFIEYMEGILAVNIPSKLSNSRHNLPWININLKRIIIKKGRRFKTAKKSGMDEDSARHLDIEQIVKRELRDAERVYVNGISTEWPRIREQQAILEICEIPKTTFGISALKSNGNMITDSLSKAEILNSQFKFVFTPQSENTFPQLPGTQFPKIKLLHIVRRHLFSTLNFVPKAILLLILLVFTLLK